MMPDWPPDIIEALWWGVRTIPMTPAPELGYEPIPLIRAGEKTHTVRGQSRKPGSIAQVSVGGKRIPLWLRFTASEGISYERMMTDDFAWADGFRPLRWREGIEQPLGPVRTPSECLRGFMAEHAHRIACGPRAPWLLRFEVVRDDMDDNAAHDAGGPDGQDTVGEDHDGRLNQPHHRGREGGGTGRA